MVQKHFVTRRTARVFYNVEEPHASTKYLWICLHGYGQLGQYFIKNFECLNPDEHWVVAPEGLSKMYLEGVYGRVGASWMTKEDRLTEIDDYLYYLDQLYAHLQSQISPDVKTIVFGFSQGGATVSRWVYQGGVQPDHLVLWSGIFPPDLKLEKQDGLSFKIWQLIGDNDPFVNDKRWNENSGIIEKLGIEPVYIPFEGEHKIYDNVLLNLANRIDQK